MSERMEFTREILERLLEPFPDDVVEFLPRAAGNGEALGLASIDARAVMRRLDQVVGPGNWSFDFDVLDPRGRRVRGRLTVLGVTKSDAGEAGPEEEPLKSAVSEALKRAAVQFGIGRYLHYLPRVRAPYDAQQRRFIEEPRLDPEAVRRAVQLCGISTATGAGQAVAGLKLDASGHGLPPRPVPADAGDGKAMPETLVCEAPYCGKLLTKGQHDVSLRAFGQPLCPACQKLQPRSTP